MRALGAVVGSVVPMVHQLLLLGVLVELCWIGLVHCRHVCAYRLLHTSMRGSSRAVFVRMQNTRLSCSNCHTLEWPARACITHTVNVSTWTCVRLSVSLPNVDVEWPYRIHNRTASVSRFWI